MHSSKADWVRGVARLISSASKMLQNTGPGENWNSPDLLSKKFRPVTSEGSRSGVNWMRPKAPSTLLAKERASTVLPMPGTSSMSTWPPATRAVRSKLVTRSSPTSTFWMFAFTADRIFSMRFPFLC